MDLNTSIKFLKGVGEQRAACYEKLGIKTVNDLIYHFPRGYVDYTSPYKFLEAPTDEYCVVMGKATVKIPEQRIRKGLSVFKIVFTDYASELTVILYNNKYLFDSVKAGEEYYLYGKVSGGFLRREMNSPSIISADTECLIRPIYHLTDGISSSLIQKNMGQALSVIKNDIYDFVPKQILLNYSLCTLQYALENIHFPKDVRDIDTAQKRLGFNELFILQLGMLFLKGRNRQYSGAEMQETDLSRFYEQLPFTPTNAQFRAIQEITHDMCGNIPMNRLLQGDVGSGKTLVAAAACYFAHMNGFQSALMAPTEILARQHYQTLTQYLEPYGVKVCLLTGSLSPKQKSELKKEISDGEYSVAVGTHALVQKDTEFPFLGLVITDEQHRFGVNQRAALAGKGKNPHTLVMSATPIPRTLGLIIYGDLDISVLDELPSGRQPVETFAVTGKYRERAYNFIKKNIIQGRQAYIVCPMIEENANELKSASQYAKTLAENQFFGYHVGLLHGKMNSVEKEEIMAEFHDGDIDLLVSTTVIEVGVDVPNAAVMMIENADRFGLSQLHQLRGRVGRGKQKSYCILVTDNPTQEVAERLKVLTKTNDGFKISEEDMKMRGCGDFFGHRQHGLPPLKIAGLDSEVLVQSQKAAKAIISVDPKLDKFINLKKEVMKLFENQDIGL